MHSLSAQSALVLPNHRTSRGTAGEGGRERQRQTETDRDKTDIETNRQTDKQRRERRQREGEEREKTDRERDRQTDRERKKERVQWAHSSKSSGLFQKPQWGYMKEHQ